jgi:hypothetical protein
MDAKQIFVAMIPVALGVTVGVIAASKIQEMIAAKG